MEQDPVPGILELLAVIALVGVVVSRRSLLLALAVRVRRRVLPTPVRPAGRPIEVIAADARRLRRRFECPPPGLRFAKYEGIRRAYDAVLGEGCLAVGGEHLLDVLRPGLAHDAERARVEELLDAYGFHLQDVA
ncbi:hypothetical protein ACT8ZV_21395 [Nocardioides sp. MAHUQ-72]|uniref:hypothetical protein n=1 Tax=unclassified Nocardioides TaxID=2615069 RepID=UPI00361FF7EC